jgi:Lrp/AsnC family leucine-responsive transcriptional regulator
VGSGLDSVPSEDSGMTVVALDRIDVKILNELQQNADLTNVELATRVNLSPSPCLTRVRSLEKFGVIDRRIAILDASLLGLAVTAFIHVKLERQVQLSLDNFTHAIDRLNQVMECYLMMGDSDYLLRVMASDIEDLEDLIVNKLARIPGVCSIKSNLALKKVSYKTVLPIDVTRPIQIKRCQNTTEHAGRAVKARYEPPAVSARLDDDMTIGMSVTEDLAKANPI